MLAGDLIAHWRAEDLVTLQDDGIAVAKWDDSVADIAAVGKGMPSLKEDALGGRAVIQFDASDGYDQLIVDRLDSPMSGRGDFTLAVVFATGSDKLVGETGNWFENTTIVDGSSLGFANDWGISINAKGQLAAGIGYGKGLSSHTLYTPDVWNDGHWHTAIYRRYDATLSLQVDATPAVELIGHADPLTGLHFSMGSQKFGEKPFDGVLADVRVYDGALDDGEVDTLLEGFRQYYDNVVPQAFPDQYALVEDLTFYQAAGGGVLVNDVDAEGDPLTAVLVEEPQHGKMTLQPDGAFLYAPAKNFFGTDSFTYTANDFRASEPTMVMLQIAPSYDPVEPVADVYKAIPNQPLRVAASEGVLANDLNVDLADLQALLVDNVSAGFLQLGVDGSFEYDPQGFAGVTTFSYQIDDGTQRSVTSRVTLVVNTPPVAADDQLTIEEDGWLTLDAESGVLHNDVDQDGDILTVTLVDPPAYGVLSLDSTGSLAYSPQRDFFGQDEFTYQIDDGTDVSPLATVRIVVEAINDLPVTRADGYAGLPDQPLIVPVDRGVLANDVDVDAPQLAAHLVDGPMHGSLQLNLDGSLEYVPQRGFIGDDTFSYRVNDTIADSAVTTVNLTITPTPVVISEFMATNASFLDTRVALHPGEEMIQESLTPDWIEIANRVSQTVDLTGMYLTDDPDLPHKWAFPPGTTVAPNGYLMVYASGLDIQDPAQDQNGRLHTNFTLGRDGGYLGLIFGQDTVLSELAPSYPPQRVDVSYGEVDGQFAYLPAPSPGDANTEGLPGSVADPVASVGHGFFNEPFTVEITTPTIGAMLVYTTDGSDPTLSHGTQVAPASEDVSPRAVVSIEGTTTLRAAAYKPGLLPTTIDTQTYLFTADIVQQSVLSSTVVDDPQWGPQLESALLALPTISLVTEGRVSLTETGTSVEMIFPDGTPGFQIDAGVEHYGGHSLNSPKKNMRLSFKSKYGESSLVYDLFGDGATDEFQQLLLRTGSHDTFFWTHPAGGRGNYLRNRWAFDRQLEMGQLAPHGRYVHVYINGTYWGMHHLMERPNADFMASYLGGYNIQYDALNAGTPIDGTLDAWREMERTEVIDDYTQLQQYLDVDNYADYMLLQFFCGNDWDWNTNQNWMAARKREPGAGYIFFAWDSDVILRSTPGANVISRGGPDNLWNLRGGVKQHQDFRMLMADRALNYFYDGGMFSDERLREDFTALADQIRLPMIAESARWGGRSYTPQTWESAVEWLLNRYAPQGPGGRAETVIEQLRRAKIYPSIECADFQVNGQVQNGGPLAVTDRLTLAAEAGVVYYTLDGSDPRQPGGELNPAARIADMAAIQLDRTTTLRARALDGDEWSALREVTFRYNIVPADATNLHVAEVHYHPSDPTDRERVAGFSDADDFEFIELVNVSDSAVDLAQVRLATALVDGNVEGVEFDFARTDITELAPHARVVIVEDLAAFAVRYGQVVGVAGQWTGGLSNSAETISLEVSGALIQQFKYSDRWQPTTDGGGYSLQAIDESSTDLELWQLAVGWRASPQPGGTPGRGPDPTVIAGDANHDGVFNSSDLVLVFAAGQYEDQIVGNSTWEQGDWNEDGDFTTADLVFVFAAGHYVPAALPPTPDTFSTSTTEPTSLWRDGLSMLGIDRKPSSDDTTLPVDTLETKTQSALLPTAPSTNSGRCSNCCASGTRMNVIASVCRRHFAGRQCQLAGCFRY